MDRPQIPENILRTLNGMAISEELRNEVADRLLAAYIQKLRIAVTIGWILVVFLGIGAGTLYYQRRFLENRVRATDLQLLSLAADYNALAEKAGEKRRVEILDALGNPRHLGDALFDDPPLKPKPKEKK